MVLFPTKISKNKLNDNSKYIYKDPKCTPVREVIQSWVHGLQQRSDEKIKFVNEFLTTFNSALWELYLNEMFIRLGYSVEYTKDSPNFSVTTPCGYNSNVKAMVFDKPHKPHKPPLGDIFNESKFKQQAVLKLLGKIKDKHDFLPVLRVRSSRTRQ